MLNSTFECLSRAFIAACTADRNSAGSALGTDYGFFTVHAPPIKELRTHNEPREARMGLQDMLWLSTQSKQHS
jgi:hypothetical protein